MSSPPAPSCQVLPLNLPSLDLDVRSAPLPAAARAYLAGLAFALAASPCSTPVLATLLAYVSSTDPVQGGGLLLAYSTGYVSPLLVAATFTVRPANSRLSLDVPVIKEAASSVPG